MKVCGTPTIDPTFSVANTFELIAGTTDYHILFPVWTPTTGCTITKYSVSSTIPTVTTVPGVAINQCTDPCNTLTFTPTATGSVSFYIIVDGEGGST